MVKTMLFIDGSWLYRGQKHLRKFLGKADFRIAYEKLPWALSREVGRELGLSEANPVEWRIFAAHPTNCDPKDRCEADRRWRSSRVLADKYGYKVESYAIDFRQQRLRKSQRDPNSEFKPQEKCVDVALATSMVFSASTSVYDVAIGVLGDRDFVPALRYVRRLGKQVAIASIKGTCSQVFFDDPEIKDGNVIWLNDLADNIRYDPKDVLCMSPKHKGDRRMLPSELEQEAEPMMCHDCRIKQDQQRQELEAKVVNMQVRIGPKPICEGVSKVGQTLVGTVTEKDSDQQCGVIRGEDGNYYFFHGADLYHMSFDDLSAGEYLSDDMREMFRHAYPYVEEGIQVQFEIHRDPAGDKYGAAEDVRPDVNADDV